MWNEEKESKFIIWKRPYVKVIYNIYMTVPLCPDCFEPLLSDMQKRQVQLCEDQIEMMRKVILNS